MLNVLFLNCDDDLLTLLNVIVKECKKKKAIFHIGIL